MKIQTMDENQAYMEAYSGAVIFHQGERYRVETIDAELRSCKNIRYLFDPTDNTLSITSREKTDLDCKLWSISGVISIYVRIGRAVGIDHFYRRS